MFVAHGTAAPREQDTNHTLTAEVIPSRLRGCHDELKAQAPRYAHQLRREGHGRVHGQGQGHRRLDQARGQLLSYIYTMRDNNKKTCLVSAKNIGQTKPRHRWFHGECSYVKHFGMSSCRSADRTKNVPFAHNSLVTSDTFQACADHKQKSFSNLAPAKGRHRYPACGLFRFPAGEKEDREPRTPHELRINSLPMEWMEPPAKGTEHGALEQAAA